jgi:hypothetical protein
VIFSGSQPDNNGNGEHCLELVYTIMNDARCESRKKVSCRFFGPPVIQVENIDGYVTSFYGENEEIYQRKGMKF